MYLLLFKFFILFVLMFSLLTYCSLSLNIAMSNQQIAKLGRACVEFGFMGNFRNPFDAILHNFVHLGMIFFNEDIMILLYSL